MNHFAASQYETEVRHLIGGLFRYAFQLRWPSATQHLVIRLVQDNGCDRVIELRLHLKNGGRN